ncbi:MAG: hypothetical protein JRN15_07545 [Nitrososphaerota archaeon]|nr:hypothetical protein [Nitrososphaerota archaeon]
MADSLDLAIQTMERCYELSKIEQRRLHANYKLPDCIITYCRKNSISFDDGLITPLHKGAKSLEYPLLEESYSPDFEQGDHRPKNERNHPKTLLMSAQL